MILCTRPSCISACNIEKLGMGLRTRLGCSPGCWAMYGAHIHRLIGVRVYFINKKRCLNATTFLHFLMLFANILAYIISDLC